MNKPQRVLREWAAGKDVLLVDLLDNCWARHMAGERLCYSPDAHLTPQGHAAAARALAKALAAQANL